MSNWAKQARIAMSQKDYIQAGDFYKLDGNYRAAIKAYIKADNFAEAARIYEETGKVKKAEKLLSKHGNAGDMAEFHLRNDNPDKAQEIYLANNMLYEAAELYEKQRQLQQAAALYYQLGFHEKAGLLYGKIRDFDKAIDAFSQVIKQLESSGHSNTLPKILKYHDWIANLHIGARRFNRAGEIFEEIHQKEKAAKCFVKAGNPVRAARMLLDLRKSAEAKQLLAKESSRDARALLGQIALEEMDYSRAAELLENTECYEELSKAHEALANYAEAAFYYEKTGNLGRAARMYARGQDHPKAALLFEQNGLYEDAAASYEILAKWGHAAKLYHMARNRYKAGFCLYRMSRYEDALKQLQMLEADHPEQRHAKIMMAEILFRQRYYSVARKLLEELTTQITLDESSMDTFYLLGRCIEEEGDQGTAKSYYERIMARRFDYRDVRERLKRLTGNTSITQQKPVTSGRKGPMEVTVGDVIADRFQIISTIGKGGMGFIFKVRDLQLDRDIALKMLIHERANFEELKVELLIARDLTHPYIIKVFDVGQWMNVGYFTMEHVEGVPLKTYIHENKDSNAFKITLLIKICEALKAAHDKDIVHRDIKPQNILIETDGNPKILDFGIARKVSQGVKSGAISGSPKYMAPEQIQNLHTDLRTDVYALGIIMFYMFTLKEPFLGKTPQEVMLKHLRQDFPEPFDYNPQLPFWLCDIIKRCCQKSPDLRFNDMGELIEELKLNLMDLQE